MDLGGFIYSVDPVQNIFTFPFRFSNFCGNICIWDYIKVSEGRMFRLIYVYNSFLYLGMLALWLLAFFHIIAISQYGLLFPQHCGLGGALGGLAVVGGGVLALGLGHLAGILRSLLWVLVALLLWQLELEWLGRLSLGFALAPPAYPVWVPFFLIFILGLIAVPELAIAFICWLYCSGPSSFLGVGVGAALGGCRPVFCLTATTFFSCASSAHLLSRGLAHRVVRG